MKIIITAYACEPNRGSEPGIGWKWPWFLSQSREYDIYVITRLNNKEKIDCFLENNPVRSNLHFFYYDLPTPMIWAKHHGLSINIYYALWLYGAGKLAQSLHEKFHFDIGHHLTFGVFRDASFLYRLHIPYIVGPLGGGDYTPPQLMELFPLKQRIGENIRKMANVLALLNPFLRHSLNKASLIIAKTEETRQALKNETWKTKTIVDLEIGVHQVCDDHVEIIKGQFLYVGRFIPLKGIRLILCAFQKYAEKHDEAKLLMVGKGEMQEEIEMFREKAGLNDKIQIIPWMKQEELLSYYQSSEALLFPSLHDSSGNVVLEAIACGLPVICLDCGGPATILGSTLSSLIVNTTRRGKEQVVYDIFEKMEKLRADNQYYNEVKQKCLARAKEFLWDYSVLKKYDIYKRYLSL